MIVIWSPSITVRGVSGSTSLIPKSMSDKVGERVGMRGRGREGGNGGRGREGGNGRDGMGE